MPVQKPSSRVIIFPAGGIDFIQDQKVVLQEHEIPDVLSEADPLERFRRLRYPDGSIKVPLDNYFEHMKTNT